MRTRFSRLVATAGLAAALVSVVALPTQAASSGLSAEQQAALKLLNTPTTVSTPATTSQSGELSSASPLAASAAAASSRRLTLYRGSALMWGRDTADWYIAGGKVTSSNVWQEAGFVFPNTSQAKGAKPYFKSNAVHSWRGNYTIGAGVVSKYGDVQLYKADYSTDWQLRATGFGTGKWN